LQNLRFYYKKASIENKQKLIGSIFPEKIMIENNECRTTRENEVIVALRGFAKVSEGDKKKKSSKMKTFPVLYPGPESNRHVREDTGV
jgi:site-specific DNA recombinase